MSSVFNIENVEPLGFFVLAIEAVGEDRQTEGGIIIPGSTKNYFQRVIAVGDDVKKIRPGDWIIWHTGAKFEHDGKEYRVAHENQILLRIKGSAWKTEPVPAPAEAAAQ